MSKKLVVTCCKIKSVGVPVAWVTIVEIVGVSVARVIIGSGKDVPIVRFLKKDRPLEVFLDWLGMKLIVVLGVSFLMGQDGWLLMLKTEGSVRFGFMSWATSVWILACKYYSNVVSSWLDSIGLRMWSCKP